jgi:hypothetical protein
MKKELINHLTWLANRLSECVVWPMGETKTAKEVKESFETFYNSMKKHPELIDWNGLTIEEARELRFQKWSDDEEEPKNLWLIPLWLYPIIPIGIKLVSIGGETIINDGKLDADTRFGCLAYGLILKKK